MRASASRPAARSAARSSATAPSGFCARRSGVSPSACPSGYDFVLVARPELAELIEREGAIGVTASIEEALAGSVPGGRST